MRLLNQFAFLMSGLIVFGSALAGAGVYHPEVLHAIEDRVAESVARGQRPVVVFDLDDTLVNTRERNLRILHDFASNDRIQSQYPGEKEKVSELRVGDIRYLLQDTFAAVGIVDNGFIQKASEFWLSKFFTTEYCALDQPNLGAVDYVNRLEREGATIVYLTGRDVPRMGEGTVANLKARGFPLDGVTALLTMKPSAQGDDLQFKISQFPAVSRLGTVVAAFENEPANINAFQKGFPDATQVFLDTIHSPKPDVPNEGIVWVGDFTGE